MQDSPDAGIPEVLYNIVRYFYKSGNKRVIKRNVTLSAAKLHCSDPRTKQAGVWFDGFEESGYLRFQGQTYKPSGKRRK